jgi:hypothetical protein
MCLKKKILEKVFDLRMRNSLTSGYYIMATFVIHTDSIIILQDRNLGGFNGLGVLLR